MKKITTLIVVSLLVNAFLFANPSKSHNTSGPLAQELIRSNLYIVGSDKTTTLVDGDLTQYAESYSDDVDGLDARKISNFSENIGMIRQEYTLAIERRHTIEKTDSIFYKIWNLKQITYQLEFITSNLNHPGLTGYIFDKYLQTKTPLDLNGTGYINFTVTGNAGSYDPLRFTVIFETPQSALPVTFNSLNANENKNSSVDINWQTTNETDLSMYSIEHSVNGTDFVNIGNVSADNLPENSYKWEDRNPVKGFNFYRISTQASDGTTKYSDLLKTYVAAATGGINVYPNPVQNNNINIHLANQPEGLYTIKLVNNLGQSVATSHINHKDGNNIEIVHLSVKNLKGMYMLNISKPDGTKNTIQLLF